MKRPTQKDVAALAGVSRATVSYVLTGRTDGAIRVSDETRRKVVDSIRKLGYRVNIHARGLRTQRTGLIALLVPDLGNSFYPILIRGAQKRVQADGYRIIVVDSYSNEENERSFVETALHHIADGLIVASSYLDRPDIQVLRDEGIPCIGIGPSLRGAGADTISIDQTAAIHALIAHLVARGHTRIAHLTGDMHNINGRIRHDAFMTEMNVHGLAVEPSQVLAGDFLREGTERKVIDWYSALRPGERPTALFAANDLTAIEAIKAARAMALRVPDDLAVCGFDNIPEAQFIEPHLTTVGLDVESMGLVAAGMLLDRLTGAESGPPREVELDFRLYVRQST